LRSINPLAPGANRPSLDSVDYSYFLTKLVFCVLVDSPSNPVPTDSATTQDTTIPTVMASALLTEVHIADIHSPSQRWMVTLHPGRVQNLLRIVVTRLRRQPLVQECLCRAKTRV
jgi:hypothetical protein